jgi:hypothetical protein
MGENMNDHIPTQSLVMRQLLEQEMLRAIRAAGGLVPARMQLAPLEAPPPPKVARRQPRVEKTVQGEPTLNSLLRAVSHETEIGFLDMISPRRARPIVRARMIYYALARRVTSKSLPAIGRMCGRRDHSTVLHGLGKVDRHASHFEPELSALIARFSPPPPPEDPIP